MRVNEIEFGDTLRTLGSLEQGDKCSWEQERLEVEKLGFFEKAGKLIRWLTCMGKEPAEPFFPSARTLQKISQFIDLNANHVRC